MATQKISNSVDTLELRNLKSMFPATYANRPLISQYIEYVLNNFFQPAQEEAVSGFIGKRNIAFDREDYYLNESTPERTFYSLDPMIVSKTSTGEVEALSDYMDLLGSLKLQNANIDNQNKLFSADYWSWSPPINPDMLVNYIYYYWVSAGPKITELRERTNAILDIIGKKEYTYVYTDDDDNKIEVPFKSGMKIKFFNDANTEYNDKCYIVEGVGTSIQLIDEPENGYPEAITPDYFVMDRGAKDGNPWSSKNRWFHKSVIDNLDFKTNNDNIQQAQRPIISFIKDLQLYNYGNTFRGNVDFVYNGAKRDLEDKQAIVVNNVRLKDGTKILITGDPVKTDNNCIYVVSGLSTVGLTILQKVINGSNSQGLPVEGEGVLVVNGDEVGAYLFYNGSQWVYGQEKKLENQSPLFELYDINKKSLSDLGEYPQTSFKGSKIFDYQLSDDLEINIDNYLKKRIVVKEGDNYSFENCLTTQVYTYYDYDTTKQILGYKFYKLNGDEEIYGSDWQLNPNKSCQYIVNEQKLVEVPVEVQGKTYFEIPKTYELKYTPDPTSTVKPLYVYHNGDLLNEGSNYTYADGKITITQNVTLEQDDYLMIKVYKPSEQQALETGYFYDTPVQLTANPTNDDIDYITYNELLEHFRTIIVNQLGFSGNPLGLNNYNDTAKDLFRGTEIIQNVAPMAKLMILNTQEFTNIQNVIEYVKTKYTEFKTKFKNVLTQYVNNGSITDQSDMNDACQLVLDSINLGKEGLFAFYNNGMSTFNNAYIPATPAYLGMDKNYKPAIIDFNGAKVLECHDGSIDVLYNDFRDNILLNLETNIYNSILDKFKNEVLIFNPLKYIPGKFRKTDFTMEQFLFLLQPTFEKWCNDNNIDFSSNTTFSKDDMMTWNWSSITDQDGEYLLGNYRGIYTYYYDTVRPHTHPWEMLGFGTKPSWWEQHYGKAPYTAENIPMWTDIENGYIADGDSKGYYEELKRNGLVAKYLPVDNNGNLLNPIEIGIATSVPNLYQAQQPWSFGDIARFEYIWRLTSAFKFDIQNILYLMKPAEWLEKNWDTENYREIFKGTNYYQVYNAEINDKLTPAKTYLQNELIDNSYIKHIGVQQWISDKIVAENYNITSYIGQKIREIDAKLGYKCGGFYKTGSIKIVSDNYGVIPSENYKMFLHKSLTTKLFSYSAMMIVQTNDGYKITGYDNTQPSFIVKVPEKMGRKSSYTFGGVSVIHYATYKNEYEEIKYNKIYTSVQEVYDIILGYGQYLNDVGWRFNLYDDNGELIDWKTSGKDFIKWVASQPALDTVILLNPGYQYIGIMHNDMVDKVGKYANGFWTVLNSNGNPIENSDLFVERQLDNTFITTRTDTICNLRLNLVDYEHVLLFDNRTVFGQILYEPVLNTRAKRLKLYGVRAKAWTGSFFAPGYIINDTGATANFDKMATDFRYFYDVDNVRAQGEITNQAQKLIGYKKYDYMEKLLVDDHSMFDFYKGYLKEKGSPKTFDKLSKSKYIMNTDDELELFENWLFKVGEFGSVEENSILEFNFQASDVKQTPQVITFTTQDNPIKENNDYILIGYNDSRWIKQKQNRNTNKFEYNLDYLQYPTAGWAQIGEVTHILANEPDIDVAFEENQIKEGDTLWIVKLDNRDWDIKKYLGGYPEPTYQTLRFNTVKEMNASATDNFDDGQLIYVGKENISSYQIVQEYDSNYFNKETMLLDSQDLINRYDTVTGKKVWMVFKFNKEKGYFDLYRIENKRADSTSIKSAYIIDDKSNATLAQLNVYDPLQGVFPQNVLDEIHYLLAIDPVDYNEVNSWGDEYVGRLWWDLDKVRYVDYEQGDLKYRRDYWGKQLPGSEIAIMEWTKSTVLPDNIVNYIQKEIYNSITDTMETWYYYWVKNPNTKSSALFRTMTAYSISNIINSPQDLGMIYISPMDVTSDYQYYNSSFLIGNFDSVTLGQDAVIQINFKIEDKIDSHKEWLLIRENSTDEIDSRLWSKMVVSLTGITDQGLPVPNPSLADSEKYGIKIRPMQSMIKNIYEARRNLVQIMNAIFASRDLNVSIDITESNFEEVFFAKEPQPNHDYEVETHKDLSFIDDDNIIGKTVLVIKDETMYNRWTLWEFEGNNSWKFIKQQAYDVKDYWNYVDIFAKGYSWNTYVRFAFDTESDFLEQWSNLGLQIGDVISYKDSNGNMVWQVYESAGVFKTVGLQNGSLAFNDRMYSFIENTSLNEEDYEYLKIEAEKIIPIVLSYF